MVGGCPGPPPPPPSSHYSPPVHFQYQQPGGMEKHYAAPMNPHMNKFKNYLSPNPPRGTQKRKRKKDIVPPVQRMTEDPVVRMPVDESERLEIEAWKAERRKHWPTEDNVRRKESDSADDTRKIKLADVLDTQKRLGLTRKAGTDDLVKQHLRESRDMNRPTRRKQNHPCKDTEQKYENDPNKNRPTLLERLLEKDIKMYKAKIVQMFQFVHMNNFLRESSMPLVFPEGTLSCTSAPEKDVVRIEPLVSYDTSSIATSTSDEICSSRDGVENDEIAS